MEQAVSKNIFLTGFMGAGKSTVGRLLANLMNHPFVDLDEMIVQRENRTIADIFSAEGEKYFRDCETLVLNELYQQPAAIYATGGGIVVRDENRRTMKGIGSIVYLKTSWATLENRLRKSVARPLVDPETGWDHVKELLAERQAFYEDADIVVETDGCTPSQVAHKIASGLML